MKKLLSKVDDMIIRGKNALMQKKDGVDQIIIMFIIVAVAAGIAGLLYIYGKNTLLPDVQTRLTTLVDNWFDHN